MSQGLEVTVLKHEREATHQLVVQANELNGTFTYDFTVESQMVGVMTLEIFAGEEQIPGAYQR